MTRLAQTVLLTIAVAASAAAQEPAITVRTYPARPLIEADSQQQLLNFELVLENRSDSARQIERVELAVFDSAGRLVNRRFIWSKGAASPAFLTVPDRVVPARGSLSIFNPFYALPAALPLDRLRYRFDFGTVGIVPSSSVMVEV